MGYAILLIIFFVLLAAFFSGSETGLVSLNRLKLRVWAEAKQSSAVTLQRMLDAPNRMLCTMLVGTNIAVVSATAIFTRLIYSKYGIDSEWIAPIIMGPIILIFGEFIPKAVYFKDKDTLTYASSPVIAFVWKLLYPVVSVVTSVSENILKILGVDVKPTKKNPFVTREEFKYLIKESEEQGVIEPNEKNIIYKIFDFGKKKVSATMNGIDKLMWFSPQDAIADLLQIVRQKGYSRFPVKAPDAHNFIGLVNTLDVIYEEDKKKTLSGFIRPISTINADTPTDDALLMLQSKKEHMAIIVDSEEKPVGFVTIGDLLEEIVGEI